MYRSRQCAHVSRCARMRAARSASISASRYAYTAFALFRTTGRGVRVGVVLHVYQEYGFGILRQHGAQASLECWAKVDPIEHVIEATAHRVPIQLRGRVHLCFRIGGGEHASFAMPNAQERVSADREEPPATIRSRAERAPTLVRAQKRLLREVIGIGWIPCQETRVSRDVREPWKRHALKVRPCYSSSIVCEFHGQWGRREARQEFPAIALRAANLSRGSCLPRTGRDQYGVRVDIRPIARDGQRLP